MVKAMIARDVSDPMFVDLFMRSFPDNEKIPLRNLKRTLSRGGTLYFFYESNEFIGFCYTFEVNETIFLVYLAVRPELRGMGYGTEILDFMASQKKRRNMFLVTEGEEGTAAEIRVRHRRKEFYKRNGWKDTGCRLLSDGVYFDSMYLDDPLPEDVMISTIKYYEEIHTGAR